MGQTVYSCEHDVYGYAWDRKIWALCPKCTGFDKVILLTALKVYCFHDFAIVLIISDHLPGLTLSDNQLPVNAPMPA